MCSFVFVDLLVYLCILLFAYLLKYAFIYLCRSEGFPRTGYFIPACVGMGGLGGSENLVSSSCRATAGAFPENGCILVVFVG